MKSMLISSMLLTGALLAACGKSTSVEGEGGAKLTLTTPASVSVRRGDMTKVDIKITRRDLPGDVAIRFDNLPNGVDVVDAQNRLVGDQGAYTLRASDGADLVENHVIQVTANGPGAIAVTQPMKITVKEKAKQ